MGSPAKPPASQPEAEAGTSNDRSMTPLRTAQAIAALASGGGSSLSISSQAQAEAGTDNTTAMSPLRVDQRLALTFGTPTAAGKAILTAADAAAQRLALGIDLSALALTGAATLTRTSLGATRADGLALINSTAAAAGAQQSSPSLSWKAFGWKTNATAASQSVDMHAWLLPAQGTANPTGLLKFTAIVNGGTALDALCIDTRGFLLIDSTNANESTPNIRGDASGTFGISLFNGQVYFRSYSVTAVGIYNGGIQVAGSCTIGFNATNVATTIDVVLARDAAGILALKNGASAQKFRVYGTTTGSKYLQIEHDGTNAKITSSSGNVLLSNLPTSNPGADILWNNAGTPAIGT